MVKKPQASRRKGADVAWGDSVPPAPPAELANTNEDVLGDLIDSGFDVAVDDDGNVRVHAKCEPGDDAAACAERVRFLVEALGADFVPPPELSR